RLRSAARPARHRPCRPIDLHPGLHRDQGGRRRPYRPDRRVLRPGRDRAVDRLARAAKRRERTDGGEVTMTTLETLLNDPDMSGVWNLVPDRSAITFKTRNMWGLVNVKGRFTDFSGDGRLTAKGAVFGRIDIRAASLHTG